LMESKIIENKTEECVEMMETILNTEMVEKLNNDFIEVGKLIVEVESEIEKEEKKVAKEEINNNTDSDSTKEDKKIIKKAIKEAIKISKEANKEEKRANKELKKEAKKLDKNAKKLSKEVNKDTSAELINESKKVAKETKKAAKEAKKAIKETKKANKKVDKKVKQTKIKLATKIKNTIKANRPVGKFTKDEHFYENQMDKLYLKYFKAEDDLNKLKEANIDGLSIKVPENKGISIKDAFLNILQTADDLKNAKLANNTKLSRKEINSIRNECEILLNGFANANSNLACSSKNKALKIFDNKTVTKINKYIAKCIKSLNRIISKYNAKFKQVIKDTRKTAAEKIEKLNYLKVSANNEITNTLDEVDTNIAMDLSDKSQNSNIKNAKEKCQEYIRYTINNLFGNDVTVDLA
ncbi:MAG: hypothetical protein RR406_05395, partial [Bacilli bacterium]